MANEETTQQTQTDNAQQGPSETQILYGIALNVIDNATRAYGYNQPGTVQFDVRSIANPSELDATQTAAIQHGYSDFVNDFLSDPRNIEMIYGEIREDGRRTGGSPELWYNSRQIEGKLYDFMLEPNGNYKQVALIRNQDGEIVDKEATRALNRTGMHPTRNLQHMNELSADFWSNAFNIYAQKYNLPADLTETYDIDTMVQYHQTELKNALRTLSIETDPDTLDEIYNDITAKNYNQADLKARIKPRPENESAVTDISNMILQIQTMQTLHSIAATRDLTDYVVNGNLPTGLHMDAPDMNRPWNINWNSREYTDENGSFSWENASDFRTWDTSVYQSANANTLRTDIPAFQKNAFVADFIAAQGWEGAMSRAQFGTLTRAMMINEAAARHDISDPFSQDAKNAFLQDYSDAYFHKHDLEYAFTAGQYTKPEAYQNALQEQRDALGLSTSHPIDANEFDGPRTHINNDEWQNFFGQDTNISDASGNTIKIENATITPDQAVDYFFRMPLYRQSFGYSFDDQYDGYDMSYEELIAKHGNEVSPLTGLTVAQSIQTIMSDVSSYSYHQLIYSKNGGPGDFAGDYERLYKARYSERLQEQHLIDNGNIPASIDPSQTANGQAPKIERDNAQVSTSSLDTAQKDEVSFNQDPLAQEELQEESAMITVPSNELAALMGGGASPAQNSQTHRAAPRA